jgi:hypothetical protein
MKKLVYHILPKLGLLGGYLIQLSSKIRSNKYRDVQMLKYKSSVDLEVALTFKKQYVKIVCATLESKFKDEIIVGLKKIKPANMPSRQVGLVSWGSVEFGILCAHYEVEHQLDGKIFLAFINIATMKHEFFAFKLQATINWMDKIFKDIWSMVTWNSSLQCTCMLTCWYLLKLFKYNV